MIRSLTCFSLIGDHDFEANNEAVNKICINKFVTL